MPGGTAVELTGISARGEGIGGVFGTTAMAASERFHQWQVLADLPPTMHREDCLMPRQTPPRPRFLKSVRWRSLFASGQNAMPSPSKPVMRVCSN